MGLRAHRTGENAADVIVVGGGLAGTTAAVALGRLGLDVILVDARAACPPVFKAEKIEPDHIPALRKLGLLEALLPVAGYIRQVSCYFKGRLCKTIRAEQYGLPYADMVHAFRTQLPHTVRMRLGRVVEITNGKDLQRVKLANGDVLTARLVVVACGLGGEIPARLGFKRIYVQRRQSVALGFAIASAKGDPFGFDAVTCESINRATGIDYLTLFKFPTTMRANLFAFPMQDLAWVRAFVADPDRELRRYFPELDEAIGEYRVAGKVETALVDLYRMEGNPPDGIVLIGDAGQNVCPTTGMGITKILTDVEMLSSNCEANWFTTPGMSADKLSSFYFDRRKWEVDSKAIRDASYRRQACTGTSVGWAVHRARLHSNMRVRGIVNALAAPLTFGPKTTISSVTKEAVDA